MRSLIQKLVWRFLVAVIVLGGVTTQPVVAQQTVTSASLSGRVEDANYDSVAGASVTVTNLDTNQSKSSTTGGDGRFRFASLPVGPYELKIDGHGFGRLVRHFTLTIGQVVDLQLQIGIEAVTANVDITAALPLMETSRTQLAETVGTREVDSLPLNGRNYLDLALLIPGVSPTNTGSNQRFAETSAVPGQGISFGGQRNLNNSFVVDGLSANDDAADLAGTYYSQEVVNQFQVITSGGIAEFGRASAGVVNVITNTGTNNWHGKLYGFARNRRFDARSPIATTKDFLTQAQYGASFSGPLVRDRSFFFTNFEQTRRNYSTVITIAPSAVATINNRLDQVDYKGPRINTGVVPASFDTTNFFLRFDQKVTELHQLSARYSVYQIKAENSRSVGGLNAVSRGTGLEDGDQSFVMGFFSTLREQTLNEARFQFTRSRLNAPTNDSLGPAVGISGVANFGTATVSPIERDIDLLQVTDSVSTQRGTHSLKAGADFLHNCVNIVFPGALQGVYNFTSLNNFISGNYLSFQQAFGVPGQFQSNPNFGVFVQDEWRARTNLTLNAGLRYDVQLLSHPIQTDTNNWAPRVGLAYAPGDRKTIIRANFGFYFDRIPLRATSNALQRDGSKYLVVQLSPSQPGAPVFPNVLATQPSLLQTKPNITRIDPKIEASYSEQANIQIQRELSQKMSLSVGYMHFRTLHLIVSRNVNVPTVPAAAGIPNLGRPDPQWGNISRFESSGDSYYDGLVVSLNKRATHGSVRVSYTLSKSLDDTGNFFFSSPQNNFDLRDDYGLSDNDQRHRLVISGFLEAPKGNKSRLGKALQGFQLGYIFTYASQLPFNVLLGSDRNFDTNNNDRPLGVGRNTGRGFDFVSLDMRLSRRISMSERVTLDLVAEGFNLLNRANLAVPNNTFGTGVAPLASFRQPTAAFDPRQFQFGLKLSF
jgi:hypothetical protein